MNTAIRTILVALLLTSLRFYADDDPEIEFSDEMILKIEDYAVELTQLHLKRLQEDLRKHKKGSLLHQRALKEIEAVTAYSEAFAERIRLQREIAELQADFETNPPKDPKAAKAAMAKLQELDAACNKARTDCRAAKKAYTAATPTPMPNYVAMSQNKATQSKLRNLRKK